MLEFELRPYGDASAVIGEEATFKEEDGKLLAFNEDGEPFGAVPKKYIESLAGLLEQNRDIKAMVVSRSDGILTVRINEASSIGQGVAYQISAAADFISSTTSSGVVNAGGFSSDMKAQEQTEPKSEYKESSQEAQPKKHKHWIAIAIVAVLVALSLYVFVVPHKSSDVSDAMYTVGTEALEVVDDYYNGDLTSYEAYKELIDLQDRADEIKDRSDYSDDTSVYLTIMLLKVEFFTDADDEMISEYVDQLENFLYLY